MRKCLIIIQAIIFFQCTEKKQKKDKTESEIKNQIIKNEDRKQLRARDLGIPFQGKPGPLNAITDVAGVEVGHRTLISNNDTQNQSRSIIRTGLTAIFPRGKSFSPVYANWYSLNGNGEMTGTTWITESGFLETPILITNTYSVGVARDAVLKWFVKRQWYGKESWWYTYPVVAETYDGFLNDIYGFHVKERHVFEVLESAKPGKIEEGNVGGGTGMICMGFKGGIGTSSRVIAVKDKNYTLGVLVQSNFGVRDKLTIAGVPVGYELRDSLLPIYNDAPDSKRKRGDGSLIVIIATDAPLLPHQLKRIAQRVPMGIALVGGEGSNGSGDIFLAFSTANKDAFNRSETSNVVSLPNDMMDPLFDATIQSVEEAILNSLVAANTLAGIHGNTVFALPHHSIQRILKKYNRFVN